MILNYFQILIINKNNINFRLLASPKEIDKLKKYYTHTERTIPFVSFYTLFVYLYLSSINLAQELKNNK